MRQVSIFPLIKINCWKKWQKVFNLSRSLLYDLPKVRMSSKDIRREKTSRVVLWSDEYWVLKVELHKITHFLFGFQICEFILGRLEEYSESKLFALILLCVKNKRNYIIQKLFEQLYCFMKFNTFFVRKQNSTFPVLLVLLSTLNYFISSNLFSISVFLY